MNNDVDAKNEKRVKYLLIGVTIAVLLISVYRLYGNGAGFATCIFSFIIPFIPIQAITFTFASIKIANTGKKTKKDYLYFVIMCITMLLYIFTFAASDSSLTSVVKKTNYDYIYSPSYLINMIVSVVAIVKHRDVYLS